MANYEYLNRDLLLEEIYKEHISSSESIQKSSNKMAEELLNIMINNKSSFNEIETDFIIIYLIQEIQGNRILNLLKKIRLVSVYKKILGSNEHFHNLKFILSNDIILYFNKLSPKFSILSLIFLLLLSFFRKEYFEYFIFPYSILIFLIILNLVVYSKKFMNNVIRIILWLYKI